MVAADGEGVGGGVDAGGRDGRGGRRWWPAPRLAALGAVLAGLLWLVALASRGHSPDAAGQARGPLVASPRLVAAMYVLLLILGTVQLTLLTVQTLRRRLQGPAARRSPWRGLRYVAGLLLLCLLLANLALPDLFGLRRGSGQGEPQATDVSTAGAGAAAERSTTTLGLGVVVLVLVLLALVTAVAARRRRGQPSALVAEELSAVVERSLAELGAERDPRRAVIAAYAGMEQTLAANGLPRAPAEAPLEYLARALVGLRVGEASAGRLTELFQRARFSHHEVGEAMKQDAIEALAAVRDELRAAAEAPDRAVAGERP